MDFYRVLQGIMDEKKLSIPDVARMCGLTDSTVRSIMDRKQKKVALNVAFKMADGLGVSLERLNGDIEKSPEAAATAPEDQSITLDESNALLIKLGYIKPGEDLSDDDLAFLTHLIGLLDAWFDRH